MPLGRGPDRIERCGARPAPHAAEYLPALTFSAGLVFTLLVLAPIHLVLLLGTGERPR